MYARKLRLNGEASLRPSRLWQLYQRLAAQVNAAKVRFALGAIASITGSLVIGDLAPTE